MFTIGEFSKITGLTVKTLRFYHEQGLLHPTHVDPETGYRYYDRSKIETARIITHLRGLDLPLEEIGEILRRAGDDADLSEVIARQKTVLETKIKRYREIVSSLNKFLDQEEAIEEDHGTIIVSSRGRVRRSDAGRGHPHEGPTMPTAASVSRKIGKAFGRFI